MTKERMQQAREEAPQEPQQPEEAQTAAQSDDPQDERELRVVMAAMKVLYDDKTSDGIVRMLQSGNPPQALAQTALFVMRALHNESKGRIPPDVLIASSERVVGLLGEMAQAAGVQVDEGVVDQVSQQVAATIQQKLQGQATPNMGMNEPNVGSAQPGQPGLVRQQMGAT